jgi:hypothetical protein
MKRTIRSCSSTDAHDDDSADAPFTARISRQVLDLFRELETLNIVTKRGVGDYCSHGVDIIRQSGALTKDKHGFVFFTAEDLETAEHFPTAEFRLRSDITLYFGVPNPDDDYHDDGKSASSYSRCKRKVHTKRACLRARSRSKAEEGDKEGVEASKEVKIVDVDEQMVNMVKQYVLPALSKAKLRYEWNGTACSAITVKDGFVVEKNH